MTAMFARCSNLVVTRIGLCTAWDPTVAMSAVSLQCVRWRKMRTDPKAKSKLDYKRIPTPIDPWEFDFLTKKTANYRTIVRAIKKMFQEELVQKKTETAEGGSAEERAQKEHEEHLRVLEWNQQENQRTRAIREERLVEENRQKEERKLQRMLQLEEQRRQRLEELADRVRQEKEASKSYITLDNVQHVIEESLSNVKDYNFTISKEGKILLPEESGWEGLKTRQEPEAENDDENVKEIPVQQG